MNIDPSEVLNVMIRAAVCAGQVIMKYYNAGFSSWTKDDSSPVTEADIASSETILGILLKSYPDFGILCEETVDECDDTGSPRRLGKRFCFIIDPLDGTRSFIKHNGQFAVSIALAEEHEVIGGVIFAPVSGKLYYAWKAKGAYRTILRDNEDHIPFSGERIHVSDRREGLIAVQSSSSANTVENALIRENAERISDVIILSSCLKGCLIAEGGADIHYRFAGYTKEWDTAAEEIICREAGGVVTDAYGGKLYANREDPVNRRGIRMLNCHTSELIMPQR